jgi:WD40 repeat protein
VSTNPTLLSILEACGRLDCLTLFEKQEITAEQLPDLTLDDLKEIGIQKLGHRKAILEAIRLAFAASSGRHVPEPDDSTPPAIAELPSVQVSGRPKVFLSYGRKDALEVAKKLERDLEAAGYEVWMDIKKIGSGSAWQQEIEDALREAQVVVSLLSPHAVRRGGKDAMDSVCLDELTYARTSNPPTPVIPVMVAPCEPPFIIYRLDYVHLQGWKDSEEDYKRGFERLVSGIRDALSGKVSYRLWEDRLKPLDFSDYLTQKRVGFTGREWLFEEIDLWRFESKERALLITGDPGAGKSSIVSQLVHLNPGGQVIAYHCCQSNEIETLRPAKFVQSLAAMIASRIPAYAEQLEDPAVREALADKRCEVDPGGSFLQGILQPLRRLLEPEEGVRYILIDALDESLGHKADTTIVDVLAGRMERLPSWLRIVATTRNEPAVLQRLSGIRAKSISATDPRNLRDLEAYIRQRLLEPALAEKLVDSKCSANRVVEDISEKSAGNFLYAVNALEGVAKDFYSFSNLGVLPRGLDGLYLDFFRRIFGREGTEKCDMAFAKAKTLLQALVCAKEPLKREELADVAEIDQEDELPSLLRRLAQILRRQHRDNGEETIALHHKSVADWLTASPDVNPFAISFRKGSERLAAFCRNVFRSGRANPPFYVRRHAVEHFLDTEDWDDVASTLGDIEFIQARAKLQELPAMLLDYAAAVKILPESRHETQLEKSRKNELKRYTKEISIYAATWRRIREGISEPEPSLPSPVQSVRLWTPQEIEAERKRISENPNRLDIVKAFRRFVATNAAPLQKYSAHAGFAAALARNDAPAGPVHDEGKKALDPVRCIKFLRQFASGEIYNPMESCKVILEGHEGGISAVRASGDGRLVVSASMDGDLRIWDTESGQCIRVLTGHGAEAACMSLSADGTRIILGGADGTLRIWDAETGECLRVLNAHEGWVTCMSLSADGARIISGGADGILRIWDTETGECLRVLNAHDGGVTCTSLSLDGARIVSGGANGTLRIWDANTGDHIKDLPGDDECLMCVDFSADGRTIAAGGTSNTISGTVRVWNIDTATCLGIFEHAGVNDLKFTADGRRLFTAGKMLRIWDVCTDSCLRYFVGHQKESIWTGGIGRRSHGQRKSWFTSFCTTFDGAKVFSGGGDRTVRFWDAESGDCLNVPRRREFICSGFRLAVAGRKTVAVGGVPIEQGWRDAIRIFSTDDGRCLNELSGHVWQIHSLGVSGDGRRIVSSSSDKTLKIWDAQTGKCLKTLHEPLELFRRLYLSFDGKQFLSFAMDSSLHLWDADTGKRLKCFAGHAADVEFVALHPSGKTFVSYAGNKYIRPKNQEPRLSLPNELRIWEIDTGRCITVEQNVRAIDVSCGGSRVATIVRRGLRHQSLCIVDAQSGHCLKNFPVHERGVGLVRLSSDARRVVLASYGTLLLYDAEAWELLKTLGSHGGEIHFLSLSEDGQFAISACSKNEIRFWNIQTGDCSAILFLRGLRPRLLAVDWNGGRVVVNREDGFLEFYQIENFRSGPLITTAQREIVSEDLPSGAMTARPSCCGQLVSVPKPVCDRIEHWIYEGAQGGYADPTLLMDCLGCGTPLRINPFFVDTKPIS